MSVISITKNNFQKEVLSAKEPVLLDFLGRLVRPLQMLSPVIEEVAEGNPHVKIGKINVDEEQGLAQQFGIMGIPALILFQDGKPVKKSVGFKPRAAIEEMLK